MASSSIGVAGTIFSITIAALSLASGQMGPRLLRNFVRDSRNQVALGIFLGTFAYALMVLRTVRTRDEGTFVPHVGVTGAMVLALVCIGTLVWFVHHIATSINVETVVDAVHRDLVAAIADKDAGGAALLSAGDRPCRGVAVSARAAASCRPSTGTVLADWAAAQRRGGPDAGAARCLRAHRAQPVAVVSAAVDDAAKCSTRR